MDQHCTHQITDQLNQCRTVYLSTVVTPATVAPVAAK